MVELVEYIVKQLVSDVENVKVTLEEGEEQSKISIRVASCDTGKIIGKQGKIASAIRTVVKAVGMKEGKKYSVEILDDNDWQKAPQIFLWWNFYGKVFYRKNRKSSGYQGRS